MQFLDPEMAGISVEIMMKEYTDKLTTTTDFRTVLLKNLFGQLVNNRFRGLPLAGFTPLSGGLTSFSIRGNHYTSRN